MEWTIDWSATKNAELKGRYGFGFERVLVALAEGRLLDERKHPNSERYPRQRQLIVEIDSYVWVVPYVIDGECAFLITQFPSRKEKARHPRRVQ